MFSRSHILIQNQLTELENESRITVLKVKENNIFELIAFIQGLPNTIWQDGVFQVYLKFNENYNNQPPSVNFQTIPYHPNIDKITGRPSLDYLDDIEKWRPHYTIKHILKSLQNLLAFPLLDRSVNMDAVFMLKGNPEQYENIVKQTVIATQKIQKALNLSNDNDTTKTFEDKINDINIVGSNQNLKQNLKNQAKYPLFTLDKESRMENEKTFKIWDGSNLQKSTANVSFNNYADLWRSIATSKPSDKNSEKNVYSKPDDSEVAVQHLNLSLKDLEDQVIVQLSEHKDLMYGKFEFVTKKYKSALEPANTKSLTEVNKKSLLSNYSVDNLLKETNYFILDSKKEKSFSPQSIMKPPSTEAINDELFEQEVDELLDWTNNI